MDHKDIAAFVKSPRFVPILVGIGCLGIAVFIFEAGVAVGFHKAEFAEHWEENYARTFGSGTPFGIPGSGVPNPHGANGRIVELSLPTFVIAGMSHEPEKLVRITDDTIIKNGDQTVDASALHEGDYVIILGAPNDNGEIEAMLVRVLPPPPTATTTPQ